MASQSDDLSTYHLLPRPAKPLAINPLDSLSVKEQTVAFDQGDISVERYVVIEMKMPSESMETSPSMLEEDHDRPYSLCRADNILISKAYLLTQSPITQTLHRSYPSETAIPLLVSEKPEAAPSRRLVLKRLWEHLRFYLVVFVICTALPSYGAYVASQKYDDSTIFAACLIAVFVFASAILSISYVRDRKLEKRDDRPE